METTSFRALKRKCKRLVGTESNPLSCEHEARVLTTCNDCSCGVTLDSAPVLVRFFSPLPMLILSRNNFDFIFRRNTLEVPGNICTSDVWGLGLLYLTRYVQVMGLVSGSCSSWFLMQLHQFCFTRTGRLAIGALVPTTCFLPFKATISPGFLVGLHT